MNGLAEVLCSGLSAHPESASSVLMLLYSSCCFPGLTDNCEQHYLSKRAKTEKNCVIFLHVAAEQHAKVRTQTFCLSLLIPIVRERPGWKNRIQWRLIESAETCVHWSCQGAGLWDQPSQWETTKGGIPQYPTKALSLEGPSWCMEMQAVQKNQLRPSKRSVNWRENQKV